LHDLLVDVIRPLCSVSEGKYPAEELIEADPQGPKVDEVVVAFSQNNIWSHVMRGPDDGESFADLVVLGPDNFGSGQIDQLHIPFGVNHEVFGFDVSANYLIVVKVLENEDYGGPVELAVLSGEQTDVAHHLIEVLSADVLLQVVKEIVSLESLGKLNHKGKSNGIQYLFFLVDKFLNFVFFQKTLAHAL
jgi:hypothetical protein